jgi:hypothetical protein
MKRVSGSLTLYGGRRPAVALARRGHSRSLGAFAVGAVAMIGYALLCGMLFLQ